MTTIYASIGNTDNKLSQQEWARFWWNFRKLMSQMATEVHGVWLSEPSSSFQNGCIAIDTDTPVLLRGALAELASEFKQDSIAVANASTVFVGPIQEPS